MLFGTGAVGDARDQVIRNHHILVVDCAFPQALHWRAHLGLFPGIPEMTQLFSEGTQVRLEPAPGGGRTHNL